MQKKVIALGVAGLLSGGAFAQVTGVISGGEGTVSYGQTVTIDTSTTGGALLNGAGHGLDITNSGTIISGGGVLPTSGVLTLNDGDATNADGSLGTNLQISGSGGGTPQVVFQATTNSGTTTVDAVIGTSDATNLTSSSATLQAGGNSIRVDSGTGTTVTGNFTATSNAYLGGDSANPVFSVTSGEGGPVISAHGNRIQNVGNGTSTYDAVNYGQLMDVRKEARRGIASASALAGLPALEAGKQYNFGVGIGHYKGESALSVGGHARINADTTAKFGVGFTGGDAAVSAGIGWSF